MDLHDWTDERLAQVPLFEGLSKEHLRRVSGLAVLVDEPAGTILTEQSLFMVVLVGEVEIREANGVIATRGSGDYIGDDVLVSDRRRTARVVTKTPVVLEVINRGEFQDLLAQIPELSEQITATITERTDGSPSPA
jgi:CRP-like cAMP-binding protein